MITRMLPPLERGSHDVFLPSGRGYNALGGRPMDVDERDVADLQSQGWFAPDLDSLESAPNGDAYQRPDNPKHADVYRDRKHGGIAFDSVAGAWRSIVTGQAT